MVTPAGTKSMKASLSISPMNEMKGDVKKWIEADNDLKKLFSKKISYDDKIDLNPKKWNAAKLSKAMEALVRYELQLLAQRAFEAKKKGKPPKDTLAVLKKAMSRTLADVDEKCSTALEDLESGKGEAKAGLAVLKKVMDKVKNLNPATIFAQPLDEAISSAKAIQNVDKKGGKVEAAQAAAQKGIVAAITILGKDAKDLQKASKYLQVSGKKLKNSDVGPLAAFGKTISEKKVLGPLETLDSDIDKLENALTGYAKDLKSGNVDGAQARSFETDFGKLKNQLKSAGPAITILKNLDKDYKAVAKHLK
ncbi:hypothetical protein [Tateyamaria sp.]|uniref:hypothetical protein n=1 Tax=Tateyamaria sp. TaxID=1929288 RepID=UPI00329D2E86